MRNAIHHRARRLAASALVWAVAVGTAARGQDLNDDEPAPAAAAAAFAPQFFVQDQNFEAGVFGVYRTADAARAQFAQRVGVITDEVDRICGLTTAQKEKLLLAARGDMKRFFDRVDEKRREFQVARTDPVKYQEFYQGLSPLRIATQNGLPGDGSLFSKALKTTLDEGQAARYESAVRERRSFRNEAKLDLYVAILDNLLGLSADQRRRVRTLIRQETRPPRKFGASDLYVILIQLARVPEEKLKPLFLESQWRVLTAQFNRYQRLELTLTRNGFLPDATDPGYDPEPAPAGAKHP